MPAMKPKTKPTSQPTKNKIPNINIPPLSPSLFKKSNLVSRINLDYAVGPIDFVVVSFSISFIILIKSS